jgi:hypothetical protein
MLTDVLLAGMDGLAQFLVARMLPGDLNAINQQPLTL